jgi:hypothetical protein
MNVSVGSDTAMSRSTREYLEACIDALDQFEYVALSADQAPLTPLEVGRTESGRFEVRVPPRHPSTPLPAAKRARLVEMGYESDDPADPQRRWICPVPDARSAIELVESTLAEIVETQLSDAVNIIHGSHRAEHEAEQRLDELRADIEPMLKRILGHDAEQDSEGDYLLPMQGITVIVAPRVIPGAISLVRVLAITNFGVAVGPELGLVLARLNFGMTFGRFVLDAEHEAIWFDETLLGESINERQMRFTIRLVAETAAEWDGLLKQMFGGMTTADVEEGVRRQTAPKPGTGGYL